jgi:type II secretory pathway component PulM
VSNLRELFERLRYSGVRGVWRDLPPRARRLLAFCGAGLALLLIAAVVRLMVLAPDQGVGMDPELQAHAEAAAATLRAFEPPPGETPAAEALPPPSRTPVGGP